MPTNLPPDYYEIEKRFREAETAAEKVAYLEQMYSVVPKHKGTDHLRADLRRQISKLKEEAQAKRKLGSRASTYHIEREGAGQVALLGPTNTGKSSLVKALTNAEPEISPAPFTTWRPTPGMMPYENIQIQLIDTPPLAAGISEPGLFDLIRRCDLAVLVVDMQTDPLSQLDESLLLLRQHRIAPRPDVASTPAGERLTLVPFIYLANKCDGPKEADDFSVLCELVGKECQLLPMSASGAGFDLFKRAVFEKLGVVRVYARPPGKEPDLERPFVLKKGSTVIELAAKVHRDFFEKLKTARIWGSASFEGQMVTREYVLQDGDIVELRI